jgi:hypothetical protein
MTHELQHVEKSVFGLFEHYLNEEVLLFHNHSLDCAVTKQTFCMIFTQASK